LSGLCFVFLVLPIGEARSITIKRMKKIAKADRAIERMRTKAKEMVDEMARVRAEAWAMKVLSRVARARSDAEVRAETRAKTRALNRERKVRKITRQTARAAARAAATQAAHDLIWNRMFTPFYG
jgi:hypothetical protein